MSAYAGSVFGTPTGAGSVALLVMVVLIIMQLSPTEADINNRSYKYIKLQGLPEN